MTSPMVKKVLSQRVMGYNSSPFETVVESTVSMSDGSTEIRYTGHLHDSGIEHEYGARCPYVERSQEDVLKALGDPATQSVTYRADAQVVTDAGAVVAVRRKEGDKGE